MKRDVCLFERIVGVAMMLVAVRNGLDRARSGEAAGRTGKDPNERKKKEELKSVYKNWLDEDVTYIITDEERKAFKVLKTDEERDQFIEQFWLRRDPDPDTPENEYKEQYWERVQYANEKFSSGIPGWKTDRGRIYIKFGKPDELESHPSGGAYQRPAYEGGGSTPQPIRSRPGGIAISKGSARTSRLSLSILPVPANTESPAARTKRTPFCTCLVQD